MLTFHQFFDKINGKMYKNVPPPVAYNFVNFQKELTSSPMNGTEEGSSYHLQPLAPEDMGRYAASDVTDHYLKLHKGKNPLSLGPPMSDGDFKKFLGQTW